MQMSQMSQVPQIQTAMPYSLLYRIEKSSYLENSPSPSIATVVMHARFMI